MKSKTEKILIVMNVLSWVVFLGLTVKAGAILISYVVSIANPEGAKNLYMGLNLYSLRQFSFWHYTSTVSLMIAIEVLKAYTAYWVIKALFKVKLANPFTIEVSKILEEISYLIFGTWIAAVLYNVHTSWLLKRIAGMQDNFISMDFIFLAGVVFVFSQIFKKGVELQSENELTV